MNRRHFLRIAALGTLGGVAASQVATAGGRQVRLTRHRLPWPRLKRPVRLLQLTDLHVGWATPRDLLDQALRLCRRARPDLIVMTGDYVNHSLKHIDRLARFAGRLPRPCVATLGNHDHWSGPAVIVATLRRQGVRVLQNQHAELTVGGADLVVVGVDDATTNHDRVDRAFAGLCHPERAIVLTHHPNTADAIAVRGGRLILAGHTHGGQLSVPIVTRAVLHATGNRYVAGWYPLGDSRARLYVNAGIGSSAVRLRIGRQAWPEIALIELQPPA